MAEIKAYWDVTLDSDCPSCHENVDLIFDGSLLIHGGFGYLETDTECTKDVLVTCPDCGYEFAVDFKNYWEEWEEDEETDPVDIKKTIVQKILSEQNHLDDETKALVEKNLFDLYD